MLTNYLKIAYRNLVRQKGYAFINIAGLVVGIACCVLIGTYLYEELSYDRHHTQADRIYRVTNLELATGKQWAPIGPPVGLALAEQIPEVELVVRFLPLLGDAVLGTQAEQFKAPEGMYADASVFAAFTVPLLQGNPETALVEPNTIVLTEQMARKYFGPTDPLGQTLTLNGNYDLRVTGVMQDVPPTTHLPFHFLISISTFYALAGDWVDEAKTWSGFYTYLLLGAGHTAEAIEERLPGFINAFYEPQGAGPSTDDRQLVLQPLTEIHLHSHLEKEVQPNGKALYVRLLGSMAVFLLLLAVINFVNLATARSAERAREVGIRKTLGAVREGLIGQFLIESVLLVLAAFVAAYALVQGVLPFFRQLSGKALAGGVLAEPVVLLGLVGLALILGVLAGSYPAFGLARLQPTLVLKGGRLSVGRGTRLRERLIVVQFVVAISLLAGTLIFYQQMQFLTTTTLGFDKEHLIDVRVGPAAEQEVGRHADVLKRELLQQPAVAAATLVSGIPGERHPLQRFEFVRRDRDDREETEQQMRVVFGADRDYVSALGLALRYGQDFTNVQATDTSGAFLLNEAAVRALGLTPEQAVGRVFRWSNEGYTGEIIGVVEDFHYASLHSRIDPLVIPLRPQFANSHLVVRVTGPVEEALIRVEAVWEQVIPGTPFDYAFLDAQFDALYRSEMRMSQVVMAFSIMALFIACLGLFGLASFTAERRTKEIGVRKVLGASVTSIVGLLSADFLKLVGIAFIIAAPVAYFAMRRWLEGFAYRVEIGPGLFLAVGLLVFLIALATVSYQAIRAATADPVKSLRYE